MLKYRREIKRILTATFEDISGSIDELDDNADLTMYGMDSIRAVALIVAIENEFGTEVEDEDLIVDNVSSIKKINDVIVKYASCSLAANVQKEILVVSYSIPFYTQRVDLLDTDLQGFKSKQEAEYWQARGCGIACVKMVIDGFQFQRGLKPSITYGELVYRGVEIGAHCNRGWIHKGLVELARDYQVEGQTFRQCNASDILLEIGKDRPCIASVAVGFKGGKLNGKGEVIQPGGHLIVVVGAVRKNGQLQGFLVHHPSSHPEMNWENHFVPIEDFNRSFSGAYISFWI